ncbi:RNA polymerase sigma factor RpoD/SigA [Kamptonema cortianum]|nr:RNA polymerase sigma factor RpoD/SigA [Geitlerinema splendidum]MDK3156834.1 RNA polymerase sigma factor RpoD/SigA [Kamptonema cortianum]
MKGEKDPRDRVPSYLERLTQAPLLTKQEEIELTLAARNGSVEARERLIESNIRLVINLARSYNSHAIPLEDLIQEGVIGLMTAVDRFDPTRGFRFSTYATHWIRQAIGRAVDGKAKTIRLPAHVTQTLRKVERLRSEILGQTGVEPTQEELASALGISLKKMEMLQQVQQDLLSLDMGVGEGKKDSLAANLADNGAGDPEARVLESEFWEELAAVMSQLTERERRVVTYRLRNDDGTKSFRDDLSQELNLSRERVRQIESQAIQKLRQIAAMRRSREYLS